MTDNGEAFVRTFQTEMRGFALDAMRKEIEWVITPWYEPRPPDAQERIDKIMSKLEAMSDRQLMDFMEATGPKPCPTCGGTGG
jgi:hypothetical protein